MADRLRYVGTWLSLVEHSLGVRGVGSSNLPVPTNFSLQFLDQPLEGRDNCRFRLSFSLGPSLTSLGISPAGSLLR
jgi:hypothetical protein